jgi:2-succinyl-5-enolpyruvyl-6-hydroxy-3-cyclohexene-1-carboxylate synthase
MMTNEQTLFAYVGAFADELVRAGVGHAVICPGSRSTPLALMLARQDGLRIWTLVDERSASFFALGLAKASGRTVALVCTSGTAAANFFPAVVEAHYARVPLLVLTADRPHELRDVGAPQAIDQVRLYGVHAKWFMDMALPEATPAALRYVRTVAGRAVATARSGPAGPVHLNFPFREPLVPVPVSDVPNLELERPAGPPYMGVTQPFRDPYALVVASLVDELAPVERGLIVCGPQDDKEFPWTVAQLADLLGWPLLADPLSGVRCGLGVIDAYDAFLRDEGWAAQHPPDVVLRFGAIPTSKPLLLYLQRYPQARQILVDGDGGWNDPTLLVSDVIHADARLFCGGLTEALSENPPRPDLSLWAHSWRTANQATRRVLAEHLAEMDEPFEGKVFAELADLLPNRAVLYVGNSMPVRDCDTFFPATGKYVRILANRGANGIDGVVSSALGASAASAEMGDSMFNPGPLVLVIGDLSFYHDMNGLLAAKLYNLDATIILLNNDGGGIFSFLPQASGTEAERFEQLFGTPTGLDFRPAVEMYGGQFRRPATWDAFRQDVRDSIFGRGLTVIEVRTDRAQNVAQHRALWPAVSAALRDA